MALSITLAASTPTVYVTEFAARHNIRGVDTATQMRMIARKMIGRRLKYQDLIIGS